MLNANCPLPLSSTTFLFNSSIDPVYHHPLYKMFFELERAKTDVRQALATAQFFLEMGEEKTLYLNNKNQIELNDK